MKRNNWMKRVTYFVGAVFAIFVSASIAGLVLEGIGFAGVMAVALAVVVVGAFLRPRSTDQQDRDATTMVAAMVTLGLGLLAGSGLSALALAGAAVATLLLAFRKPMHGMLRTLTEEEVRAIARFAVISIAVLPFLPDAHYGPYGAWNPFKLWLVVLLVTGFSIAGYVLNRAIGQDRGTITTALIGGAAPSGVASAATAALRRERATPRRVLRRTEHQLRRRVRDGPGRAHGRRPWRRPRFRR